MLFPQGGTDRFVASSFWPALASSLALAVLLPARERALRAGALLFALLLVAAFVVDSPLGGNATRLGALAAGPVVLGALIGRRSPWLVAALALPRRTGRCIRPCATSFARAATRRWASRTTCRCWTS